MIPPADDDHTRTTPADATRAPVVDEAEPVSGGTTRLRTPSADPEAGTLLADKYRLVERIGEGGMGSVWAARQTNPI